MNFIEMYLGNWSDHETMMMMEKTRQGFDTASCEIQNLKEISYNHVVARRAIARRSNPSSRIGGLLRPGGLATTYAVTGPLHDDDGKTRQGHHSASGKI